MIDERMLYNLNSCAISSVSGKRMVAVCLSFNALTQV